ncbi:hypothetical protein Tco_1230902 [Tanacetum coccineum]
MPTTHVAKEDAPMPYDLPLLRVYLLGSDEGSLTLNELTILYTSLFKKVESLEYDLKQTKQTYGVAYTKLIMKVKKLEHKRRKIAQIDKDEGITLVQMGVQTQGRSNKDLMYKTSVYDYPKGFIGPSISITTVELVTTAGEGVSTARAIPEEVSTIEPDMDVTLAEALVDLLKSGKKKSQKPEARGISFQDPEEVVRREKKDQIQSDEELSLRLHAEEQAEFKRLQKERASQEEASRAVIYEEMDNIQAMIEAEIQKLFDKTYKHVNSFVPMASNDKEKGSEKKAGGSRKKTFAKKREGKKQSEESSKRQKMEDDAEKEELRAHLDIILGDDVAISVESLATKYPIVDWKTHVLSEDKMQDVLDLYRLVKERFKTASPEGYDRLLWGDLITVFEPSKDDEVWKAQQDYTLIS